MTQRVIRGPGVSRDGKKSDQIQSPAARRRAIAGGCPQARLFVCLSVSSVLENEAESPNLGHERPGTINRNMRDMAGNAEDVLIGLREWRQTALPGDMEPP